MRSRSSEGLLLVDKPAGMTSHDVVAVARRALGERRIGHAGTLDPFATGLLVLLVGSATRLAPYLDGEPKVYDAVIRFGFETDTDDATGARTREAALPEPAAVDSAIARLTGDIEQRPPAFSAKRVKGRRAYAAARSGEPLALRPTRVSVQRWEVTRRTSDRVAATITCSGGTYIRALARDLGALAGSAAHLEALRRTRSGPFDVATAATVEEIRVGDVRVREPLEGLATLALEELDAGDAARAAHGNPVPARSEGSRAVLVDGDRRVIAIAERAGDEWRPRAVLRGA